MPGPAPANSSLLNGNTVSLDSQVGVIAGQPRQVESLAGIMGGDATGRGPTTPKTSTSKPPSGCPAPHRPRAPLQLLDRRLHRFERGVDPEQTVEHIERITQLDPRDHRHGETVVGPITDAQRQRARAPRAPARRACAARIIGCPSRSSSAPTFARLGLAFTDGDGGVIDVTPPSWRFDLQIEEDLVEEVIRPGLRKPAERGRPYRPHQCAQVRLPEKLGGVCPAPRLSPPRSTTGKPSTSASWKRAGESELAGNDQPIALLNPIASQLSVMRLQPDRQPGQRAALSTWPARPPRARLRAGQGLPGDESVQTPTAPSRACTSPCVWRAWPTARPSPPSGAPGASTSFDVKGDLEALFAPRKLSFVAAEHPALSPRPRARSAAGGPGDRRDRRAASPVAPGG